jgi:hypothetical protein
MHGLPHPEATTVKVHRQFLHADIVAEVGDHTVLLIEDKVYAGLHGDQLVRYRREIEKTFTGKRVLPVFLKTGDQSSYKEAEQAGYKLLLRHQIMELLHPFQDRVSNAIFQDFVANLELRETEIESFRSKPVSIWSGEWDPWIGFYKLLQRKLSPELEWDYVANASGGFLGAWWHSKEWTDQNGKSHHVYLQIEQGPLCFKIAVSEETTDRADLRQQWREQLLATANEIGVDIPRPARMRSGTYMTIGRIELKHWMVERADGSLEMSGTLMNLRKFASVLWSDERPIYNRRTVVGGSAPGQNVNCRPAA